MLTPINEAYSRCAPGEPAVGMGATEFCWSDRNPFVITEVVSPKLFRMRAVRVVPLKDMSGYAAEIKLDEPYGPEIDVKLITKKGRKVWAANGNRDRIIGVGKADYYYDPHF